MEDAKDAPYVQDLRCMTLIDTQLRLAKYIFLGAQKNPLPPPAKRWTTTVAYVNGSLARTNPNMGMSSVTAKVQPEGCTLEDRPHRSISLIMGLPVRYGAQTADGWYCPPRTAQDALLQDELDMMCGYMLNPMHLRVQSKGPTTKSWWEDPVLLAGRFMKNGFFASVLEHPADQNEPVGFNPPTWGDMYRPTRAHHQPQPAAERRQKFQDRLMTSKRDDRDTWVPNSGTPGPGHAVVSCVVNVRKEAE